MPATGISGQGVGASSSFAAQLGGAATNPAITPLDRVDQLRMQASRLSADVGQALTTLASHYQPTTAIEIGDFASRIRTGIDKAIESIEVVLGNDIRSQPIERRGVTAREASVEADRQLNLVNDHEVSLRERLDSRFSSTVTPLLARLGEITTAVREILSTAVPPQVETYERQAKELAERKELIRNASLLGEAAHIKVLASIAKCAEITPDEFANIDLARVKAAKLPLDNPLTRDHARDFNDKIDAQVTKLVTLQALRKVADESIASSLSIPDVGPVSLNLGALHRLVDSFANPRSDGIDLSGLRDVLNKYVRDLNTLFQTPERFSKHILGELPEASTAECTAELARRNYVIEVNFTVREPSKCAGKLAGLARAAKHSVQIEIDTLSFDESKEAGVPDRLTAKIDAVTKILREQSSSLITKGRFNVNSPLTEILSKSGFSFRVK